MTLQHTTSMSEHILLGWTLCPQLPFRLFPATDRFKLCVLVSFIRYQTSVHTFKLPYKCCCVVAVQNSEMSVLTIIFYAYYSPSVFKIFRHMQKLDGEKI